MCLIIKVFVYQSIFDLSIIVEIDLFSYSLLKFVFNVDMLLVINTLIVESIEFGMHSTFSS